MLLFNYATCMKKRALFRSFGATILEKHIMLFIILPYLMIAGLLSI